MIHCTTFLVAFALVPALGLAKTVYSDEFDYRYLKSTDQYFLGKTAAYISRICDAGEHASNDDLAQCSHLKFNRTNAELKKKLNAVKSEIERNDKALKADGEPLASPYFQKAQTAWVGYRDNECYSETYMMGEAAERYIFFWECMANISQSRAKELDDLLKD